MINDRQVANVGKTYVGEKNFLLHHGDPNERI